MINTRLLVLLVGLVLLFGCTSVPAPRQVGVLMVRATRVRLRFLALAMLLAACSQPLAYPPPPYEVSGVPAVYVEDTRIDSPAAATWHAGRPEILWQPFLWDHESDVERVFDLAHEHCHFKAWDAGELAADCCAVQWMRRSGYLPSGWLADLVDHAMDWKGDAEHPDGPERAVRIMECAQ